MAKKTTSRSNPEPKPDATNASAPRATPRGRARATTPQQSDAPVAMAQDRATSVADQQENPTTPSVLDHGRLSRRRPAADDPMAAVVDSTSRSMASEPSEDDIRIRAYHRYLERGGGHGMDFDDWLEAERELRETKVRA
jgi:Protein of unknown function (DUF2934)